MKSLRVITTAIALISVLSGAALAQANFPAVKVADMTADSVVSLEVHSVAYTSISGGGASRTGSLATRRLTGFIYSADGYIVTDSNGISDNSYIKVHFNDGSELEASFVGNDDFYGIGVVKVEPEKPLKPVTMVKEYFNETDHIYPYDRGDAVVAIGNSGGFGGTVTYGIISGVRVFRNRNYVLLPSVIQADVVINSGNEGCPLFNDKAEMIGMHEHRGGGGSMQNTTFFQPAGLVSRVADEIIADFLAGDDIEVWHPWLGIKTFAGTQGLFGGFRSFSDDLKMYMDIPDQYWDTGIAIDTVYPESPAKEFGLLNKDILMAVTLLDKNENEKRPYTLLKDIQDLEIMVTTAKEGDIFVFQVLRKRKIFDVEVVVGQHPGPFHYVSLTNAGVVGNQVLAIPQDSREFF